MKNGVVYPVARERSRAKALEHLYNFAMSYSNVEGLAIENAACEDDATALITRLGKKIPKELIYHSRTTPVIGTHTGPGLILVAVLGDRK